MKKKLQLSLQIAVLAICSIFSHGMNAQRQMENLNRGTLAVRTNTSVVLVTWRILGTEYTSGATYNLYRGTTLIASNLSVSNYADNIGTDNTYSVAAVLSGVEQAKSTAVSVWSAFYKTVAIAPPAGGTSPDGVAYTYTANDCSVGDMDGDGEYEIILKWEPTNAKDNSQSGYTGNVFLDAIKLSGTRLWRIDLGKNIRAGAHYTQFMVYDLNGDGKSEIACKTAPGTKDGTGAYLTGAAAGTNNASDYRNSSGYILTGPEYLTLFNGQTGKELITVNYEPARGTVSSWGDSYGNRVDRFLACVAYLDGVKPSLVMCRGYYTRSVLVAYDWNGSSLTKRWTFDSNNSGYSAYAGQGCHNLAVGDLDSDGYDEIVYGSCTIDHNGAGKYTTGLGHGDAVHLGDFNPSRSGLEVWQAHESASSNGSVGGSFRDANTGSVIWKYTATGDIGRGLAADVDGGTKGVECWASGSGLYSCTGTVLNTSQPASVNFGVWWDGDDLREILDGDKLDKYGTGRLVTLYNYEGATYCNSTKRTPNLQADILGDWREEVILHSNDNTKLVIFSTTTTTSRRMYTLMHDKMYRLGIAWQNVAYNQPPDLSFYFGGDMSTPPNPSITLVGSCSPTAIVPYVQTDGVNWAQASAVSLNVGGTVKFGPQPASGGSWSWSGPNSFSATTREVTLSNIQTSLAGNYVATYTNTCGSKSTSTIAVSVTAATMITLTIQENTTGFCSVDGTVDSNNAGYTGTGFANTNNASGSGVSWTVNVPSASTYSLKWRYANLSGDRSGALKVDGTTVISSLSFSSTAAWTTWTETSGTTVSLAAGNRVIRLEANQAAGLGNIDYMSVTGVGPTGVNCTGVKSASDGSAEKEEAVSLAVFPNPVGNMLTVSMSGTSEKTGITILTLNGVPVMSIIPEGAQTLVDVSALPKGVYLVQLVTDKGVFVKQIVKQ